MKEWNVHVAGIGYIGTVHETKMESARLAALHQYAEEGTRSCQFGCKICPPERPSNRIYEDDTFSVSER